MTGHYPNLAENGEAQFARLVADAFRERGWNVSEEQRSEDGRPDLAVSGPEKKLIIEIKRTSEGRRDREPRN